MPSTPCKLEMLGRPAGFLARTVEGWAARGAAVGDLISPHALSEVVAWLRCRVPPSLIHSDFKLDDMILAPGTLAPMAVIDWDMGPRGDPLLGPCGVVELLGRTGRPRLPA